jgi:N-acetylmuramoyl-L-alanine amidase
MNGNYSDEINQMAPEQVLGRTAWGEGRSGGAKLMQGIINSIATRVANPDGWGFNFRGVCLARNQYDCWNENDPNLQKLLAVTVADPLFVTALNLANAAIVGELEDIVNGADSYCETGKEDGWFQQKNPISYITWTEKLPSGPVNRSMSFYRMRAP